MNVMAYLQEYGVVGVIFTVILSVLKYYKKQGWKSSKNLSDREKIFRLFLKVLTIVTITQVTCRSLEYTCLELMKELKYVDDVEPGLQFVFELLGVFSGVAICSKQEWKKRDGVDKKKEEYSIIAYVDVIMIVVTIFFRMIYKCAIIDIVCLLSIVAFFWIILNVSGKKEYELQYVTFFSKTEKNYKK